MPDFSMSPMELNRTNIQVNEANKKIGINYAGEKSQLGKDSFLKLLVTELSHQDPTKPMEDKQFIAQMAQFSSLEQMTNLNKEMRSLIKNSSSSQAYAILGKRVEAMDPVTKKPVSGIVSSIYYSGDQMMLKVGNRDISMDDIHSVHLVNEKDKKQE